MDGTPERLTVKDPLPPHTTDNPSSERLSRVADTLREQGVDVEDLELVQEELSVIEEPEGFFQRTRSQLTDTTRAHWGHVVGELSESQEVLSLLRRRLVSREALNPDEQDMVRCQLLDALRVVPAGFLAIANAILPVPGTSALTPWLLIQTGLMPSRWREAHALAHLERKVESLRAQGMCSEADAIEDIATEIGAAADARERALQQAILLQSWDENGNGVWDPEERTAYDGEVQRLRELVPTLGHRRRWFGLRAGEICGPARLNDLTSQDSTQGLLVCLDDDYAWIVMDDLLAR